MDGLIVKVGVIVMSDALPWIMMGGDLVTPAQKPSAALAAHIRNITTAARKTNQLTSLSCDLSLGSS
jgi:hypothetical protein